MKNTPKSLYLLGILCLPPIVGFCVGILLIFYGVFKYKNRKLVILGILGMVITNVIYSWLFYELKYGKKAAKEFAEISQQELNDLTNNIELYKLKTGNFPDSLRQLKVADATVNIDDPLLVRKMDKKIEITFMYRKLDSGFTVYSVGIDGISGTSDDVYPDNLDSIMKPYLRKNLN